MKFILYIIVVAFFFCSKINAQYEEQSKLDSLLYKAKMSIDDSIKYSSLQYIDTLLISYNKDTVIHIWRSLATFFADDKYYYAQTLGPVRFLVLDGGEDKPDTSNEYSGLVDFDSYRYQELEWLKKEVAGDEFKNAPFKIVIIHMPIIENKKNWHGMAFLAQHFGPVLEEAGIDLMISGHTHRNAWIDSDKSGFGYPIMISSNNHFIEAEVDLEEISLLLKDINGNVEAKYTCNRQIE